MSDLLRIFGPWGLVLVTMAWLLKVMVTDKLKSIMDTLSELVNGQKNHNDRIVKIETIMGLNGCMEGEPMCHRRKGDE